MQTIPGTYHVNIDLSGEYELAGQKQTVKQQRQRQRQRQHQHQHDCGYETGYGPEWT